MFILLLRSNLSVIVFFLSLISWFLFDTLIFHVIVYVLNYLPSCRSNPTFCLSHLNFYPVICNRSDFFVCFLEIFSLSHSLCYFLLTVRLYTFYLQGFPLFPLSSFYLMTSMSSTFTGFKRPFVIRCVGFSNFLRFIGFVFL